MKNPVTRDGFRDGLVEHGWLLPSGVPGVFGRTHRFESVVEAISECALELGRVEKPERVYFPPVINREILRATGYMENFPQLCGSIHSYAGDDRGHPALIEAVRKGQDWGAHLAQTDVTLCPAACYPLYPTLTGKSFGEGKTFQLTTFVFRNEPSDDPARMQIFRQHEHVFVGTPAAVRAWRDRWKEQGVEMLRSFGLPVAPEVANDMFFGRGGRMMKATQREQDLKYEALCQIANEEPTAIASFNDHEDHYGRTFKFEAGTGVQRATAHTACVGFGLERITLALVRWHGFDPRSWPAEVRRRLAL